jgi:hypothetical protein
VRVLVREHVGVDEGRLQLVLDAIKGGLDSVLLEMHSTRVCMHHRLALRVAILCIASSTSISTPAVTKAMTGCISRARPLSGMRIPSVANVFSTISVNSLLLLCKFAMTVHTKSVIRRARRID